MHNLNFVVLFFPESDRCVREEANQTKFKDKAVQAVPTMVDRKIEVKIDKIDLYDNQGNV